MKIHNVQQGSPEWLALRRDYFTASEAAAMMGVSPYMTRSELLRQKFSGLIPDTDDAAQRRFDQGHAAEESYRPIAEATIGEELYPVTGSAEIDGLMNLLASFDGLTMDERIGFEHKLFNADIVAALVNTAEPPQAYIWQLEQQLLVSGASYILFVTSDGTNNEYAQCEYRSHPDRRAALIAGWKQFALDMAAYVPEPEPEVITAAPTETLPAPFAQVTGSLTVRSNLDLFGDALRAFVARIPKQPSTDQEFADAEAACKKLKEAEDTLDAAENSALASLSDVEHMRRTVANLRELARQTRLTSEKVVKARKETIRTELRMAARNSYTAHIEELQREISAIRLDAPMPDFDGAIKGLKTLSSIKDRLDTALANGKIAANELAAGIRARLAWVSENAQEYRFLLADLQQLVAKPMDDFTALITARIETHKRAEAARQEVERERIRKEEAEKLATAQAQQAEEAARQEAERAKSKASTQLEQHKAGMARRLAAADGQPTLRLGQINDRLAPIALTADGLALLGFTPAATDKAAKLYHERDFQRICAVLVRHIQAAGHSHLETKA
jgi:putative phage-type endonuclease